MLKKVGIVMLLALMFMFSFTGCEDSKGNVVNGTLSAPSGNRFVVVESQGNSFTDKIIIYADKETGVTYALYASGYGVSFIPLYNADGTLCVYDLAKLTDK